MRGHFDHLITWYRIVKSEIVISTLTRFINTNFDLMIPCNETFYFFAISIGILISRSQLLFFHMCYNKLTRMVPYNEMFSMSLAMPNDPLMMWSSQSEKKVIKNKLEKKTSLRIKTSHLSKLFFSFLLF